jgi:hypothetical protein
MKFNIIITALVFLAGVLFSTCDTFTDNDTVDNYEEGVKSVDGQWQLSSVSRNGIDITSVMDFSQFRLSLSEDGAYKIENYLPFVVRDTEGTWEIDDPQYPFHLRFYEGGVGNAVTASIKFPAINGKRIISISFSPGCDSNTYVYVFEKIAN